MCDRGPCGSAAHVARVFVRLDRAHYVERFGFTLDFEWPPGDVYYARVSHDGVGIMLKAITPDVLPHAQRVREGRHRRPHCGSITQ